MKLTPDDLAAHAGLGLALANLKDPKAQAELDWLKSKAQACGDTCPDAAQPEGAHRPGGKRHDPAAGRRAQAQRRCSTARCCSAAPRPATRPMSRPSA